MKLRQRLALIGLCYFLNLSAIFTMDPGFSYDYQSLSKPKAMGCMLWLEALKGDQNKADYLGDSKAFRAYTKEITQTIGGKYGISTRQANPAEQAMLTRLIIGARRAFIDNPFSDFYGVNTVGGNEHERGHLAAIAMIDTITGHALKNGGVLAPSAPALVQKLFYEEMQNFPLGFGVADSAGVYLKQDEDHRAIAKQIKKAVKGLDDTPTLADCLAGLKTWNASDFVKGVYQAISLLDWNSSAQFELIVSQLDALPKSKNVYINGHKSFLRSQAFFRHNKFEDSESLRNGCLEVLNGMRSSHSPYFRYIGVRGIANVMAEYSNWKDAVAFIEANLGELPKQDTPKLKLEICKLWSKEREALRLFQIPLLEEIIKSGDLKLKAKATHALAQMYQYPCSGNFQPEKALALYEDLLANQDDYINRYRILDSFIRLLSWDPVRDEARAFKFCQEILANRKLANKSKKWIFPNATNVIIGLYAHSSDPSIKNPQLAYEMAEQVFYDKSLPSWARSNIFHVFINSLRNGPAEIKEEQRAFKIANEIFYDKSSPSHVRVEAFRVLIDLLRQGPENIRDLQKAYAIAQEVFHDDDFSKWGHECAFVELILLLKDGPDGIKNHQKAIELFESNPDLKHHDTRALEVLSDIYQNGECKDLNKAIKVCHQLLDVWKSYQQNECEQQVQLRILQSILAIYKDNPTEPLDFEAAADISQAIEAHPCATAAQKLEAEISLSEIHAANPESVLLETRHMAHLALANNPMASPIEKGVALTRLIAVYQLQGNLPEALAAYEQRLAVAEPWQRLEVLNSFITFLEDQANVTVADPDRLLELTQQRNIDQAPVVQHNWHVFFNQAQQQPQVQLPGLVPGFGGQNAVDPYYSPEIIANRMRSLRNLSQDAFDVLDYQNALDQTLEEIEVTIAQYASTHPEDQDYAETATKAYEVFAQGNSVEGSFDPILNDLNYVFDCNQAGTQKMILGEALIRIQNRINGHVDKDHLKEMYVVQLAASISCVD